MDRARAERDLLVPEPVPLPDNLPDLYRAFIDDLMTTLNEEGVSSRASDELHDLIDAITVRYDDNSGAHTLWLDRSIVDMLTAARSAGGGAYAGGANCSLKLVAGVGFEPTTFRL